MSLLDTDLAFLALARTGSELIARRVSEPILLTVAGGSAGLLAGLLRPSRTTADCDVLWVGEDGPWELVGAAARAVASDLALPPNWLNRDCTRFAWCLPLGWAARSVEVGRFGPLDVRRLSRIDLIASKVMGAPRRPVDLNDLIDINPCADELIAVREHLDRLVAEDLDSASFEQQAAILEFLRSRS